MSTYSRLLFFLIGVLSDKIQCMHASRSCKGRQQRLIVLYWHLVLSTNCITTYGTPHMKRASRPVHRTILGDYMVALLSMIFNVQKTYIEYTSNTNYSAFCIFKNLTNLSRNFKEFQRVSKKYSRRKFCSRNCQIRSG